MTLVTGRFAIGGGANPEPRYRGNWLSVRPTALFHDDGTTHLPVPQSVLLQGDGSFSVEVNSLPEGWAYEWVLHLGGGEKTAFTRTTSIPASGTVLFEDLVDVVPPGNPGLLPPSWAQDLLDAIDSAVGVNDGIMAAAVGTGGAFDTKLSGTIASEVGGIVPPMVPPLVASALADDDTPAQAAALAVADALEDWDRTGTGSPEGVVTAPVGVRYRDTAATRGAVLWVKAIGTGNTGWVVTHGETGVRSVALASGVWVDGGCRVSRVGRFVEVWGKVSRSDGAISALSGAFGLPAGFRPQAAVGTILGNCYYGTNVGIIELVSGNRGGLIHPGGAGNYEAGVPVTFAARYLTNEPWPTALPGTAA